MVAAVELPDGESYISDYDAMCAKVAELAAQVFFWRSGLLDVCMRNSGDRAPI